MSHGSAAPSLPDPLPSRAGTRRHSTALGRRAARLAASPAGLRAQEALYLVLSGVIAVAGLLYLVGVGVLGSLLVLSVVGLPLAGALVVTARVAGRAQRELVGVLLHAAVAAPSRFRPRPGLAGWTRAALGDVVGWRALAYLAVRIPVVVPGAALVVVAGAGGVLLVTHPVVRLAAALAGTGSPPPLGVGPGRALPWPQTVALAGLGVVVLLALPWLVRRLVAIDRWLVDRLLGPTADEARAQEVRREAILRAAGVLRHLGDPTEERAGSGPAGRGRTEAGGGTGSGVEGAGAGRAGVGPEPGDRAEPGVGSGGAGGLRSLGRPRRPSDRAGATPLAVHGNGSGPSAGSRNGERSDADADVAVDAGARPSGAPGDRSASSPDPSGAEPATTSCTSGQLAADLVARASRSPLPVRLHLDLKADALGPEIEVIARDGADELLANAEASSAGMAEVSVAVGRRSLVLRVSDDGCGGAATREGGGLERLSARLTEVDGLLVISSPEGGPTDVTVAVPLPDGEAQPPTTAGAVAEGRSTSPS